MISNNAIHKYLDLIDSIVVAINADQTVSYINQAGCRLLGYNEGQVLGKNWFDHFVPLKTRKEVKHIFSLYIESKMELVEYFESSIITSTGEERVILWNNITLKNNSDLVASILFSGNDLTKNRMLQNELIKSKKRLEEAYAIAKIGVWELDIASGLLDWTDGIYSIFEIDKAMSPANYEAFLTLIHPDDKMKVNEAFIQSLQNRAPYEILHRLKMKDGRIKWVNEICQTEYDKYGNPIKSVGTVQDVTAQIQKNEEVEKLSAISINVIDALCEQIAVLDSEGIIVHTNAAWQHSSMDSCIERERPIGESKIGINYVQYCLLNLCDSAEVSKLASEGLQTVLEGNSSNFTIDYFAHQRWFIFSVVSLGLVPNLAVVLHTDITERKQIEHQRLLEETLNRNTIVREVHHRIKNNLQGVVGILQNFNLKHPELSVPITEAISKVHSISLIYGMQGRVAQTKVRLCELTNAIAKDNESLWETPVSVDIPQHWIPCRIAEAEAVPLALVLNELILNAIKHSDRSDGVNILLRYDSNLDKVILTITNSGCLPPNFIFSEYSTTGTGLELVASLLPKKGINLYWEGGEGKVSVRLELFSPIIKQEQREMELV